MKPAASVVIVTGASRGIGAAVCRWLGKIGTTVILVARDQSDIDGMAADVIRAGGHALAIRMDIRDDEACRHAVEQTLEQFGHLNSLVNNAGILQPIAPIADADPEAWRTNMEANLLGPFLMTRAAIPALRQTGGRVVNVSSGAAVRPVESWSAYCAAKAGLNQFTRILAIEEPALTAVAIRPGVVDTRMQATIRREGPGAMPPDRLAYFQELKTSGRLEPPRIPARAIAWLSLYAPRELSGEFIDYTDPRIAEPALAVFGEQWSF